MTDKKQLLTDLQLNLPGVSMMSMYHIKENNQGAIDFMTVAGDANLIQAIIMRLLTPLGELAPLGHPNYGSRLHELIGKPNTENIRHLMRLYILTSLKQESRIAEINEITIRPVVNRRTNVSVQLRVKPIGVTESIVIGPFTLELGS
jgi:phage baseplate assembly protein W